MDYNTSIGLILIIIIPLDNNEPTIEEIREEKHSELLISIRGSFLITCVTYSETKKL